MFDLLAIPQVPKEVAIGDVYLPPLMVAGILGLVCTSLTVRLLNKVRWHRFIASPPLIELALTVLYTLWFGTFVFPS